MESKWAPGPWEVEQTGASYNRVWIEGGRDRGEGHIANVFCGDFPNHDWKVQDANTRLIAAAPEMYEALSESARRVHQGHAHSITVDRGIIRNSNQIGPFIELKDCPAPQCILNYRALAKAIGQEVTV